MNERPARVCLAQAERKEIGNRPEEQMMHDLADGRIMFVPRSVRDQLSKLGIKPGERFQICKREVNDEGEECIEWTVNWSLASQAPSEVQLVQSPKNGSAVSARSTSESNGSAWS